MHWFTIIFTEGFAIEKQTARAQRLLKGKEQFILNDVEQIRSLGRSFDQVFPNIIDPTVRTSDVYQRLMFQREELAHANGFFGGVGHGMFIKRHPDIEIAEGWRAVTFRNTAYRARSTVERAAM
ncbi:hypothetical protein KCU67_g14, partial [Aureobasidium melanogenum]